VSLPLSKQQLDWLETLSPAAGGNYRPNLPTRDKAVNPCVAWYGAHNIPGVICKNCSHLERVHKGKVYIKCDLRAFSNGAGTDHKATWPACAKYVEVQK
jgi:hypothetical protein